MKLQQIFANLTNVSPQNQLAQVVPQAGKHYIRAREDCAAQGRHQGDGSGWACATSDGGPGAYLDWGPIRSSLVRGDTYYVAGSDNRQYTSYQYGFVFPPITGTAVITIKKANAADNGGDAGWDPSFASKQAVFDQVYVCTSYITFDGVTGGGPNSWTSGLGFLFHPSARGGTPLVVGNANGMCPYAATSYKTFRHIELWAPTDYYGTYSDPFMLSASLDHVSYLTGQYLYIHGGADLDLKLGNTDHALIEYSAIGWSHVISTATNHTAGTRIDNSTYLTLRYNWFNDHCTPGTTGQLGIYDGASNAHIYYYGNVFSMTNNCNGAGPSRFVYQNSQTAGQDGGANDVLMYNNSFINIAGDYFWNNSAHDWTNSYSKNNLFYNLSRIQGTPDTHSVIGVSSPALFNNSYGYYDRATLFTVDPNPQVVAGNPYAGNPWDTGAFALSANTQPGTPIANVQMDDGTWTTFNVDMYGHTRTTWSRGAVEYTGSTPPPPQDTAPPSPPTGISVH